MGGGSNKVHTFSTTGKLSKNAFKRFSKKWNGAIASFVIDDYVERTIGDWKSGWWVWGEDSSAFEIPVICRATLKPMQENELIMNYGGNEVFGRIIQIEQCKETGNPIILMENVSASRNGVILKEKERALH